MPQRLRMNPDTTDIHAAAHPHAPVPTAGTPLDQLAAGLHARPFVLLALASGLGCAWGAATGANAEASRLATTGGAWTSAHISGYLAGPLLLCCYAVAAWMRAATSRVATSAAVCTAVLLLFAWAAHQRQFPPPGDISRLVRGANITGPIQPVAMEVQGTICGTPRRSDFGQEFPFAVTRVRPPQVAVRPRSVRLPTAQPGLGGAVWVRAPRDENWREGDVLALNGELMNLPRAGNFGERQRRARYISALCWSLLRVRENRARLVHRETGSIGAHLVTLRAALQERYANAFRQRGLLYPDTSAQLLSAMILGDRAGEPLPYATREAFRRAGLTHLLVASGSQVALLCALMLAAGRALGLRGFPLFASTFAVLLFYALLTGGAASIWRAAVGGGCLTLAAALGRPADRISLLAVAFVCLLCIDPAQIQDIGFQLTFAATWGLAVLAPALSRRLGRLQFNPAATQFCGALLGAQLATLPFLLYHFGQVGIQGLAANALALPLAALLVGSGLLGLFFSPANLLNYHLAGGIREIAEQVAGWPGAGARSLPISLFPALLLCGGLLIMTINFSQLRAIARDELKHLRPGRHLRWTLVIVAALTLASQWRRIPWLRDNRLRVTLLDVGQGESIVISSAGRTVLIDGGSSSAPLRADVGASVIVPFLQSQGVRRLDALIITHADADHCNALKTVLREVPVDTVIDGAGATPDISLIEQVDYLALRNEIRRRGIPFAPAKAGLRVVLGDAWLDFLAPLSPPVEYPGGGNNGSAVTMLHHGEVRMLFTGDIESAAEARLAGRTDLRCDILKVAHHGSKTSTGPAFLRAARPRHAMLSCGRYNSFGHPSIKTLTRLAKAGVPVWRTDRDGAISVFSDGRSCEIKPFR